jgi:hypothetical protein
VAGDLQIVNVPFPVRADVIDRGHRRKYTIGFQVPRFRSRF